jgi:hypothetical protein
MSLRVWIRRIQINLNKNYVENMVAHVKYIAKNFMIFKDATVTRARGTEGESQRVGSSH